MYAWQLYLEALALFNRGVVELPDEFKSLQRVANRSRSRSLT
jgi:hypothetical protein